MSRLSLAIAGALALILSGCVKNGTPENVTEAKDDFKVVKLFVKDECNVYRFYDNGRYHYFTNCSGTTMTHESYQCGKSRCSRPKEITGSK